MWDGWKEGMDMEWSLETIMKAEIPTHIGMNFLIKWPRDREE
jgi:hypothetical protein